MNTSQTVFYDDQRHGQKVKCVDLNGSEMRAQPVDMCAGHDVFDLKMGGFTLDETPFAAQACNRVVPQRIQDNDGTIRSGDAG